MDYVEAIELMDKCLAFSAGRRGALVTMVRNQRESKALLAYRKAMALSTVTLKADGHPATLIETMAKGDCAEQEAEWKQAQIEMKACLALMESTDKSMNALQSQTRIKE